MKRIIVQIILKLDKIRSIFYKIIGLFIAGKNHFAAVEFIDVEAALGGWPINVRHEFAKWFGIVKEAQRKNMIGIGNNAAVTMARGILRLIDDHVFEQAVLEIVKHSINRRNFSLIFNLFHLPHAE